MSTPQAPHLLLLNCAEQEAALTVGERRFLHSGGPRSGQAAPRQVRTPASSRRRKATSSRRRLGGVVWAGLEGGDRWGRGRAVANLGELPGEFSPRITVEISSHYGSYFLLKQNLTLSLNSTETYLSLQVGTVLALGVGSKDFPSS